jgi:hypothetical protein
MAGLAHEAAPEPGHDAMCLQQGQPEPMRGSGVVGAVPLVLGERDDVRQLHRVGPDRHTYIQVREG